MADLDGVGYVPFDTSNAPPEQSFFLPDDTKIRVSESDDKIDVYLSGKPVAVFERQSRKLPTSFPVGVVNDDRVAETAVLLLRATSQITLASQDLWAVLYALWIRRTTEDLVPISFDQDTLQNAEELKSYLILTGLGFAPKEQGVELDVLLVRASFWQGAGTSPERHWLRSPVPNSAISTTPFPFFTSFTRSTNVCTTHPMRPPKPPPGSVLYARYIFTLGEMLTLVHINANDPKHFEAYMRWQNSDRVNAGWKERGPEEHHRQYLADRLTDPHIMGFLVIWDGKLAGYGEMSWVKEDHMSTFVGGLGDYDQGKSACKVFVTFEASCLTTLTLRHALSVWGGSVPRPSQM
jgi:hypothetical protein